MISRKKRFRYKINASKIAKELNLDINLDSWEEIWNLLDKYEEPTYLYVIGECNGKEVKIGSSKNPGFRLKQLQTAYPNKLLLWGYCKEVSPLTEKEVHRYLKDVKISGEWFSITEKTREIINKIKQV